MEIRELLGSSDLFRHVDPSVLEVVASQGVAVRLERNQRVFDEGDPADELYVVRSGRVVISNRSPDGRESVVALMEAGDLFGDMGLFDGEGRSAEARSLEASELIGIPYAPVRRIFEEHPVLLWEVVRFLSGRLRNTDSVLADAVFLDVTGRTAKRLLELAGDQETFTLPLTQEELAAMVGASRERVNKALSTFVRLGWISQSDRRYTINDRRQLKWRSH